MKKKALERVLICVISLVHHYLENYGSGASDVLLQADNCVGQNKNNCTMQYLVWHTMTKRDLSVELSFMLTGQTSFLQIFFLACSRNSTCILLLIQSKELLHW